MENEDGRQDHWTLTPAELRGDPGGPSFAGVQDELAKMELIRGLAADSCLDRLLEHKQDFFVWLQKKWADLFHVDFEVLLYDTARTYSEGEMEGNPKAKRGYSRDRRPDCVRIVSALVVTTDSFPLAYEVMNGNTIEPTTLSGFLD